MRYRLPKTLLEETFYHFRHCGAGKRECQALWVSSWGNPEQLTATIHPAHDASAVGFQLEDQWLSEFWSNLAARGAGVRVQCHTHPGAAFHSSIDDAFPIVHTPGFLSLVIPNFALGPIGFSGAYLAQIDKHGGWRQVRIDDHLELA
ncbi:MAG: hypothetical protein IT539_04540 [Bradyrhizobiaceae bacterium]|nr:hypothetical protein [Bradyrhizobiaceae bacterium]